MILYVLYHIIVVICFVVSLVTFKYTISFKIFPWLMGFILLIEWLTYILGAIYGVNPFWLYHFSLPVYGALMIHFYYGIISNKTLKSVLLWSIAAYVASCLYLTFFFYTLKEFPGLSVNILGILLIAVSLYVLFTLEPIYDIPLHKHPVAWICFGVVVFYASNFFLNGIYNYLVETKSKNRALIHSIVNHGANCIMYLSFIAGLICSDQLKKYQHQT